MGVFLPNQTHQMNYINKLFFHLIIFSCRVTIASNKQHFQKIKTGMNECPKPVRMGCPSVRYKTFAKGSRTNGLGQRFHYIEYSLSVCPNEILFFSDFPFCIIK